jgi:hypothetical protein
VRQQIRENPYPFNDPLFIVPAATPDLGIRYCAIYSDIGKQQQGLLHPAGERIFQWGRRRNMTYRRQKTLGLMILTAVFAMSGMLGSNPAFAAPFFFSTDDPDGKIATASRPGTVSFEIESADDFVLAQSTSMNAITFTGLLTGTSPSVNQVVVEMYRVFPLDSNVSRTSGPPTFSTSNVPTRVNSPSDAAFAVRDSTVSGDLTFSTASMGSFTASNSVTPGSIHPSPNQTTGGNGPVTGNEVLFTVTLTNPILLPADHYFFVPQVDVSGGDFLWLSAPKPIVAPGTPFAPDLQSWTRDEFLAPDWLRVGTDITGQGPFNAVFSLTGESVPEAAPEPASILLLVSGLVGLAGLGKKFRQ